MSLDNVIFIKHIHKHPNFALRKHVSKIKDEYMTSLNESSYFGIICIVKKFKGVCSTFIVGRPEGKRPLGRPRCRWVDNIRMDLGEVGWGDVDWIGLSKDRNRWRALVNSVLNLRVP
jgi:hypothetical protein